MTITGTVRKRSKETLNKKLATGEVEVFIKNIEVVGKRTKELPFEISENSNVREDLRRKSLRDRLILRANVMAYLRKRMTEEGFLEIQTPILTSSSPEGARDYLVPSRVHPGTFYALPQAPQQFKQLLMVSGIDKYFQIAPCFRDEDARADRSPRRILSTRYGNVVCRPRRCI